MSDKIEEYVTDIQTFNKDRIFWLRLSGFVATAIILLITNWYYIENTDIYWLYISAGLLLSLSWWYWTMKLVRNLLSHKILEFEIISSLFQEIVKLKHDIVDLEKELAHEKKSNSKTHNPDNVLLMVSKKSNKP